MKSQSPGDQFGVEFISETPHFFKIILDDTGIKKLRVPKKFARRYGSEISSPVSFKVPSGESWKVELTKCADGTWLRDGWSEFARHYSLSYGSFLVFRYEGNCNFHVIIFDKTATEISYPCGGFQEHAMEDNKDDISVEILDGIQPSKKTRVRSSSPSSRPRKKISSTSKDGIPVEILYDFPPTKKTRSPSPSIQPHKTMKSTSNISIRHSPNNSSGHSAKRNGKRSQQMEACRRKSTLLPKKRTRALPPAIIKDGSNAAQRFASFKSENPFMLINVPPSCFYHLSVPYLFIMEHIKQDAANLTLENGGKMWPVKVLLYPENYYAQLGAGWFAFAMENEVTAGEMCAFELINREDAVLRVIFFRN